MSDPSVTDWLTAIGTFGAVLLALGLAGRDIIDRLIHHPTLDVTLRHGPPDCIITETRDSLSAPRLHRQSPTLVRSAFYCRLQVHNNGNRRAENVEVRMTRLWRCESDGSYREDGDFVPMNLRWSFRETIVRPAIQPGLPEHCDFCFFAQTVRGGAALLTFVTEVQPNQVAENRWPTRKSPGKYRAEIVVTADNAKPKTKSLEIDFTANWSDDPVEIAEHGLRVDVGPEPAPAPLPTSPESVRDYLPRWTRAYPVRLNAWHPSPSRRRGA